jgi:glutamyl-tRNA reductase
MDLIVLGVSHKTAPAEIRDEVQVHPEEVSSFYAELRAHQDLIREVVILSTCNRTEFYGFARNRSEVDQLLRESLGRLKGVPHLENGKYTYSWSGRETVRHLFRVSSGMDSLMIGESQILGQVRTAFEVADQHRAVGALLTRLFNTALHVGKRARSETEIGMGTVSVAHAAVELAQKVLGSLERYPVLVLGAGETGTLVARHFADAQPKKLMVANRTRHRADVLAMELGGVVRRWEALDEALHEAKVIVAATGAREPIIDAARMASVLKRSGRGPKVMVDIGNPRNVDPKVGDLDRLFLYDLDALESIADQNRARRRMEIPKVEGIIVEEVDRFLAWYESLDMVPVIRALRGRFHEIAEKEIERQVKNFDSADREALKEYTRALLNKLLHQPTTRIRGVEPTSQHGINKLVAIQELFELDLESFQKGDDARSVDAQKGKGPSDPQKKKDDGDPSPDASPPPSESGGRTPGSGERPPDGESQ